MDQTIRTFIAFPIPESLRDRLAVLQNEIGRDLHHLRPVKPQGIHLTLRFLGDIQPEQVYQVGAAMEQACLDAKPFKLICAGAGAFPNLKSPRVIWTGLRGDVQVLLSLYEALSAQLEKIGFSREPRPFSPHLTLFRVKSPKQMGVLRKRVEKHEKAEFGKFSCDTLVLYQSDLKPDGAVYTKLKIVGLD